MNNLKIREFDTIGEKQNSLLNHLIYVNHQRIAAYELAGEKLGGKNEMLRDLFYRMAKDSRVFRQELGRAVIQNQGEIASLFIEKNLQPDFSAFQGQRSQVPLLAFCKNFERNTLLHYDEAILKNELMDTPLRNLILAQREKIHRYLQIVENFLIAQKEKEKEKVLA